MPILKCRNTQPTSYRLLAAVLSVFSASILCSSVVFASTENMKDFGDYTVHYSAFTSDSLQPAMAKAYGITRSKNRALLSISILKKSLSPLGTPVKAAINAEANNLTGQWKKIDVREIDDGSAVYYVSEFRVAHKEILNFKIEATPEGSKSPLTLKFQQQFYTD